MSENTTPAVPAPEGQMRTRDRDELAEVLAPDGYPTPGDRDRADAMLASDWLARRDQRVAAEVLREAADDIEWEFRSMTFQRGGGCDSTTNLHPAGARLRERADRIEAGDQ